MSGSKTALLALIGACMSALPGCSGNKAETKPRVPALSESLFECSPFNDFDGTMEIIFRADGNVSVMESGDGRPVNDKSRRFSVKWESRGTDSIAMNLYGDWADYTLYRPHGDVHCILSQGAIRDVDLQSSWFGTPDLTPEPDERSY